ncbi:MAG: hypothetical protein WBB37_00595 [bacterium]
MKDTGIESERLQIEIFRKMLPETKLNLAMELTEIALELVKTGIKYRHPEYAESEVETELKKILLTEEIFQRVYSK